MDASLLQPLFVDCSVEYELDMTRFPGWDDPEARAQPTLMLPYPDRQYNSSCPSVDDELQNVLRKLSTTEDEFQTLLREFIMTEDELHSFVQDFCPSLESSEDDLPSIIDDVFSYADILLTMTGAISPSDSDHSQSPETFESATQTDDTFMPDGPTLVDFLSDFYIRDPSSSTCFSSIDTLSSPTCFSSIDTLSSTPTVECGIDFYLHSQELHHSCRKRQISDDSYQPSAKRQCNHGDDYHNELLSSFITDSSENEMSYGFSGCVRD
ncbi:uncharacterized protein LOC110441890 [Mizuhopecten yessoensis]|uniref:Uncharacterized protein n=1 Tax=Mizuhopecten yessoensis TaxID=6573 RepID=A0A210PIG4_MIZYE|nr:uncharacterized protein LOC110441890 [Mizuhopecten yessoensis]OWF36272.1 hypothetical protein KP79_PYT06300 [Mizuhopecten yessoensis]